MLTTLCNFITKAKQLNKKILAPFIFKIMKTKSMQVFWEQLIL